MANPNNPMGFVATPLLQARRYKSDADSSTPIYFGDVVQMDNDGKINAATAGETSVCGSALTFLTGSAAGECLVADNPFQEFLAQDDGDSTTSAETHIGTNCNHIATAGTLLLKKSSHEIDISSTTASAAGFALLDFVSSPGYSVGANSIFRVLAKLHHGNVTTGI